MRLRPACSLWGCMVLCQTYHAQAAEGDINAEFNVIRRLRVRLLLSEYAVAWRGNRTRRLGCGVLSGACPRALWVPRLPPRTAALFGASRLLRRWPTSPGFCAARGAVEIPPRGRAGSAWPFPLPSLNTRLSTVLMLSLWPNQCAFPGVLLH